MKTTFFSEKGFIFGSILLLICTIMLPVASCSAGTIASEFFDPSATGTTFDPLTMVPDCVEIGDIVLIDFYVDQSNLWKRPGLYNEHGAIYVGNNTLVEANGVVRYRDYTHFLERAKNLVFLRVTTANESQRHAAAAWAESKIGSLYQNFFDFPWFGFKIANTDLPIPSAKEIYCMELLWAAYYLQGIDIDRNGWRFPYWVTGNDIIYDDDTEIIYTQVNDSTEIIKPNRGMYVANRKISFAIFFTIVVGNIDIEVNTSNHLITKVDFYIDSVYKSTDTTPPYVWRWDERGSGKKVISAIASDDFGNHYYARITVMKFF